jgi:4-alpha-glucanotransferase
LSIPVLDRRRAGILLHVTSLPGRYGNGDFSHDSWRFVEFLRDAGATVWQTLPLGYPHLDGSPYQCLSAHAGNPLLISLDWLADRGWLSALRDGLPPEEGAAYRLACLREARSIFEEQGGADDRRDCRDFVAAQAFWLEDFALYMALRETQGNRSWRDWPAELRDRDPAALAEARAALAEAMEQPRFEQWVFFRQWRELREYAHGLGVLFYGDLPIFVSADSADVWVRRDYFRLDAEGREIVVAGVPPDYFSEQGQRWGNPLYDWERMEADGFQWWKERLGTQLGLFDWMRIDHFRGFDACWEIPAEEETALNGRWVAAPGHALLRALREVFTPLPLIAEDLGTITPGVGALREAFDIPGMTVAQFGFDGNPHNPYLPHNHTPRSVTYTGTHDNDTSLGWFRSLPEGLQSHVLDYLGYGPEMPDALVRAVLASCARLAVVPMQDVLGLGEEGRMNTPSTTAGNWGWRFRWEDVDAARLARFRHWVEMYGRA